MKLYFLPAAGQRIRAMFPEGFGIILLMPSGCVNTGGLPAPELPLFLLDFTGIVVDSVSIA